MNLDKSKIIISGLALLLAVVAVFVSTNLKTYTVTFDSKMGTSIKAQEVKNGDVAKKPDDPTMEGYTFEGWYLEDKLYSFDTPVKKDITLTGKWQENK